MIEEFAKLHSRFKTVNLDLDIRKFEHKIELYILFKNKIFAISKIKYLHCLYSFRLMLNNLS